MGSNITQSIAGLSQAERLQPKPAKAAAKDAKEVRRKVTDRVDTVETTQASDAVKSLADNTQEDAREDHQERDDAAQSAAKPDQPRPSLDVSG